MLGVFAAGRILNDKTARSQAIGGIIWGVGQALTEENHVDPRYGSFEHQDLAGYHVPVHADIANLDALFVAEEDDKGNPLKIKGVGELGICGAGAARCEAACAALGADSLANMSICDCSVSRPSTGLPSTSAAWRSTMSAPLPTCIPRDLPALIAMRVLARNEADGVTARSWRGGIA